MNNVGRKFVLVTGATGYVVGRLVPRLLQANFRVRVLVRGSVACLEGRAWKNQVEVVSGDVLEPVTLAEAMRGIDAAYYLIRRMSRSSEIGAPDVLTYADMMMTYARIRGLRRVIISVPVLTPRLSSYWVHWITPVSSSAVIPLIEGLHSELMVRDHLAGSLFPDIEPIDFETALRGALERAEHGEIETLWSDALAGGQGWLQFEANKRGDGRTDLVQTAYFASKGISGLLYWYSLYPIHRLIFSRMIDAIARKACEYSQASLSVG